MASLLSFCMLFVATPFSVIFLLLCLVGRRRPKVPTIGFFHPYADAGGGGERVLWHAVSAVIKRWPSLRVIVYTGDSAKLRPADKIIEKVGHRFGLVIPKEKVEFVRLRSRFLIEARTWPRFTLLGQCIGSVLLGMEALLRARAHVLFDTMGYAFVYPVYRWFSRCTIVAYVHYPIVSIDMLSLVTSSTTSFNNDEMIARSRALTNFKIKYYRALAYCYGFVGRCSDITMVNSSWTYGHITNLWRNEDVTIVFPPCDVETFSCVLKAREEGKEDEFRIVSVGQYRPEKNQREQLKVLRALLDKPRPQGKKPILVMIGSCRDENDHRRVEELRKMANELGIIDNVHFLVNVAFKKLLGEIRGADAAIHTMVNEHFGITLVECMSAGCIMVAHRSGGPKLDIVIEGENGYLAESTEEFTQCILQAMSMSKEEREAMRERGANHVNERFSVSCFESNIVKHLEPALKHCVQEKQE